MRKAILYFLLFVVINLAIGLIWGHVVPEERLSSEDFRVLCLLITSGVNSSLVIALFAFLRWCPVSRDYVRSRPWGTLFWSVLLAIGMILPLAWVESFIPESMTKDVMGGLLVKALSSVEGYFVICMLAPLAEEVVFRGAIISAIIEWGSKKMKKKKDVLTSDDNVRIESVAIVVSALLFALVHLNPAQIPHALIAGVLLGWVYARTRSILPCFIIHWINNSSAYVMVKLFPSIPMDAPLIDYFNGNTMAMYQAVGSSLLIALPALYQLHRRMRVA